MRPTVRHLAVFLFAALPMAALAQAPSISTATATQSPNTLNYTVDVKGSNFVSGTGASVVYINGTSAPTTYLSSTEVTATFTVAVGTTSVSTQVEQTSGNSNTVNASTTVTKVPIVGLTSQGPLDLVDASPLDNSMNALTADPGYWTAAIVQIGWNQIQPNSSSDFMYQDIETALNNIAAYNASNHANVTAKLRIFTGPHTPGWAVTASGGGVTLINGSNNESQTYPQFWTANYRTQWQNLQSLLAARYDKDPRIQQVSITSCTSSSGEPFVYPSDYTSVHNMRLAGLTDQLMETCLNDAYLEDYNPWVTTPIDYTMNPFLSTDNYTQSNPTTSMPDITLPIMYAFHHYFPVTHAVVGNHDLKTKPNSTAIYFGDNNYPGSSGYGLQASGPPLTFQAYGPDPSPSWSATVSYGFNTMGMTELEMFPPTNATYGNKKGLGTYTNAQLKTWAAEFPQQ